MRAGLYWIWWNPTDKPAALQLEILTLEEQQ